MAYMLCRNRVKNANTWRAVFASHAAAHRAAGLHLVNIWPALDDPHQLFFFFQIESRERAEAFIADPAAAQAGAAAGVLDGEYHFLAGGESY